MCSNKKNKKELVSLMKEYINSFNEIVSDINNGSGGSPTKIDSELTIREILRK